MFRSRLRATRVGSCVLVAMVGWIGSAAAQERAVIVVPDPADSETEAVTQLYRAINDTAHENALVLVRAGEYLLDADKDEFGHDGYLAPPPGMEIRGENVYRDTDGDGVWDEVDWDGTTAFADPDTETIIDASGLEVFYTDMPPKPRSVLGLGRGQVVRSLTVRAYPVGEGGRPFLGALIGIHHHTEAWDEGLRADVYDCVVGGSSEGIFLGNHVMAEDRPLSRFTIEGNVIRDLGHGGIVLINRDSVVSPGGSEAYVAYNRVSGTSNGLIGFGGIGINEGQSFRIVSVANLVEGNVRGAVYYGSYYAGSGNTLEVTSIGDRVWGNNAGAASAGYLYGGGIIAIGGLTDQLLNPGVQMDTTNNTVWLEILDGDFVLGGDRADENLDFQYSDELELVSQRRDILLIGGYVERGSAGNADGNSVHLLLRDTEIGDEETALGIIVDDLGPGEHEGSNAVTVDDDLGLMQGDAPDGGAQVEEVDAGDEVGADMGADAPAEPSGDSAPGEAGTCDAECEGCNCAAAGSGSAPIAALLLLVTVGLALRRRLSPTRTG